MKLQRKIIKMAEGLAFDQQKAPSTDRRNLHTRRCFNMKISWSALCKFIKKGIIDSHNIYIDT
jgi:hypothetical protein